MNYALRIDLERPFDEALAMIKESLAESGFGILTEINLKATLKNKIDVDIDDQIILGACNPRFAYRGLQVEPSLGLLLPCNVVLFETPAGEVRMGVIDPMNTLGADGGPELQAVAAEVGGRLGRVLAAMQ